MNIQSLYNKYRKFTEGIALFLLIGISGCKKFVEVDTPSSRVVSEEVFVDDASATAAIYGIYSEMYGGGFSSAGTGSIGMIAGLSSDELINYAIGGFDQFYTNNLIASNDPVRNSLWGPGYKFIFYANSLLEGLGKASGVSDSVKNHLIGEAKFVRAFCYFYLVNLFGEIPIATTTDYRLNNRLSRSGIDKVYELIVNDLTDASALLSDSYPGTERIRPNTYTVKALLARVYLYLGEFEKAEDFATQIIESGLYNLEDDLDNVFLNTSREAIWQMKPLNAGNNTNEANLYILRRVPSYVSLRPALLDSFNVEDKRLQFWIRSITPVSDTYYYTFKYKRRFFQTPYNEYSTVFRLGEVFLIRAEARANQDNLTGAIQDIDQIRGRAGIELIAETLPGINKPDLLNVIMHERLLELFSEWGHRWFDLKRTGRANSVLTAVKGSDWDAKDILYPIPSLERINNNNLSQNDGY